MEEIEKMESLINEPHLQLEYQEEKNAIRGRRNITAKFIPNAKTISNSYKNFTDYPMIYFKSEEGI